MGLSAFQEVIVTLTVPRGIFLLLRGAVLFPELRTRIVFVCEAARAPAYTYYDSCEILRHASRPLCLDVYL